MITWVIVGCLMLLFGAVVFRGAPYVPSHRKTIEAALDALHLAKGDTVVDLGAGDGAFLKVAAKRGYRAIGYEINPLLCCVAWLRCWPVRMRVTVRWRDFWVSELPADTKAVYFFLAGPFMAKAGRKLQQYMVGRTSPLMVASNGFAIPGLKPIKIHHGVYVYRLEP